MRTIWMAQDIIEATHAKLLELARAYDELANLCTLLIKKDIDDYIKEANAYTTLWMKNDSVEHLSAELICRISGTIHAVLGPIGPQIDTSKDFPNSKGLDGERTSDTRGTNETGTGSVCGVRGL